MNIRDRIIKENIEKGKKKLGLTDWEKEFLESIEQQIKEGKELSSKQFNWLKMIAEK